MAKCVACGKFLSPAGAATCTTCPCMFHRGCVAIPESEAISKDWICPECKKKQRKGDNSSTPVKGICGALAPSLPRENLLTDPPSLIVSPALPPSREISAVGDAGVLDMRRELTDYMAEQREFRNEFRAIMSGMRQRMDLFEQRLEAVERSEGAPGTGETAELQRTVVQLKMELNDRDQEALLSDIDIGHLPEEKGENVLHSVSVLAAKLGVALEDRDIVFAERVGAFDRSGAGDGASGEGGRARRVVVRLARRSLRDEILHAARVRRGLTTVDLCLAGPPRRVYVNERLTRTNRQLFHQVREEARKRQWRYTWTKRGRVFARQSDGKAVYAIRSDADLARVFENSTV